MNSQTERFRPLLRRAIRLKCLVCGRAPLFRDFIRMHRHCPECGFVHEREDGYFLGAIYFNYGVTGIVLVGAVLFHHLVVPFPQWLLIVGGVLFGLVFPVWFSRWSRSAFMALDQYYHPPDEKDFVELGRE